MQRNSFELLWQILSVIIKEAKIGIEEIAVSSVPDDPIWHSETIEVDITFKVIEFDMSSTSVFLSRFNELRQIYFDFCHMYTGGRKLKQK